MSTLFTLLFGLLLLGFLILVVKYAISEFIDRYIVDDEDDGDVLNFVYDKED